MQRLLYRSFLRPLSFAGAQQLSQRESLHIFKINNCKFAESESEATIASPFGRGGIAEQ